MTGSSARGKALVWAMTGLLAAGMMIGAPASAATSESAAGPAPTWRSWYSSSATGLMWGVAAFSTKSIWAVGTTSGNQPIVIRWDGSRWASVNIPGSSGFAYYLIAGSSASNIWIIGINTKNTEKAFHWDGARWHTITTPTDASALSAVATARSVWITGQSTCAQTFKPNAWKCLTLLYRWSGREWQKTSIREPIESLGAAGGTVMAAGAVPRDENLNGPIVAFRWTGAKWAAVSMPHPLGAQPRIGMDSASDVWISSAAPNIAKDYELHWNGHTWRTIHVTANVAQTVGPPQVVPDGHGGAWLGDWAHYTGGEWVAVGHAPPPAAGHLITTTALTHVPGASDTYVESGYTGKFGGPYHPAVYIIGPLP